MSAQPSRVEQFSRNFPSPISIFAVSSSWPPMMFELSLQEFGFVAAFSSKQIGIFILCWSAWGYIFWCLPQLPLIQSSRMSSSQLSGGGMSMNTGFTKLCKGLGVVLIGGHIVVQILPSALSYLALIPAKTIPFAWNLITAGYIEQSTYGVIISILGLLFIGKLLEPIWGSREFFKFIFIVNFLTSVCVFTIAISLYYITRQEIYLYQPISGFQGVLSGFLVGIKQIIPDQELSLLKIKAKWLPSLALLVSVVASFLTTESAFYLPILVIIGTYISWIYLRYWQRLPETNLRGDPSDEFAFSTFFPGFLRPVIGPLATILERMFCGKRPEQPSNETSGYTLGGTSLPGSDSTEASRRRERGARALEERLASERLRTEQAQKDASENA